VRIAFLGPEGTFSEEALLDSVGTDEVEPVPLATIFDCVIAVQEGTADRALVPIENSLEGSVNTTIDALVFETDRVQIVGEVVHPIRHCLIAREQLALESIERVLSHPQASAQCARFLRTELSHAEVVPADSTADAVRIVAGSDQAWAALGPRLSAKLYGCRVLLDGVEDIPENETRFAWLAPVDPDATDGSSDQPPDPDGAWKTSIVFWGLPDAPGSLVEVLQEFAAREVNLSRIESRPRKQGLGRYIFFADLEGHCSEERIAGALAVVGKSVETLRVLGCYPAFVPKGR
jgi:prephenate dehydratase